MAVNIKFDLAGNPEPPTIILATRNGNKLGQLDVDEKSIELKDRLNDASEFSFTLNKYVNGKLTNLWDDVTNFKLVYCKEWDKWFEIVVELDETVETIKTVTCTQLGQAELSQIMLYNVEINTEDDIARDDYKISILWDVTDPENSILSRLLKDKAPHYSIIHVDSTIAGIQRMFSFDDISIYDAFQEIAEEIGCLFIFHSNSGKNGSIQRTISVYDLQQNCLNTDCKYRGEFTDVCPKCGSTSIDYNEDIFKDTLIFVTSDELADGGIQLTTDTDSVKNCFKLEAGDDLMTATIRNCNPNGTDYIWRFSDDMKEDMPNELVKKIESYDEIYKYYYSEHITNLDESLLSGYNAVVDKYSIYNEELQKINTPIVGYSSLMNAYYNTIDLELYLESALMPSIEMSETNAEEQGGLLRQGLFLSTVAVANLDSLSLATADNTVLAMAKIFVKPTYRVKIDKSELSDDKRNWSGNFIITSYSDEEDTTTTDSVSVFISGDYEEFVKQKLEKALNKENTDDYSISGLFEKDYDTFCQELNKYALKPLISFKDACQACIDILIEQGVGSEDTWGDTDEAETNLYQSLYLPYYNKLSAIEAEIKVRESEISIITGVYDSKDELVEDGLQTNIEKCRDEIQDILNFEKYLGEELWLVFCSYRREDKYSNDNYISDGLDNAELFKNALDFFEVAENEIYKASEQQHSISTTLNNLLAIPKFKSLVKYFNVGNWIRIKVDDYIYKLRLIEYAIDFGDFNNIHVEFSDVLKVKNGTTDVKDILEQASSMATSYGSVQRQASLGNGANGTIAKWLEDGLNSALVQIQSNDNEEITLTKNGLLCRTYDDITESYSPEQLKLTHNIMAYTDDNWESVSLALGKHDYMYYDEDKSTFVNNVGYGLSATFVQAGYVLGSQIIGGDIYSDNYSESDRIGSHLNLRDGSFNLGGALSYDGEKLTISSDPNQSNITEINENWIKTTSVYAQNLEVRAANVYGKLTAATISADDITAGTIDADSISVRGTFETYNEDDDITGYMGAAHGSVMVEVSDGVWREQETDGVAISNAYPVDEGNYVIVTDSGARMQVGSNYIVVGQSSIALEASGNKLQLGSNGLYYNGQPLSSTAVFG